MPNQHKGKYSHPTKMPSQDPHDPNPRNPKRTQSCRLESSEHRHLRFERRHERREDEREALLDGDRSKAFTYCLVPSLHDPCTDCNNPPQLLPEGLDPTGQGIVWRLWKSTQRGQRGGTRNTRSACARRQSRLGLESRYPGEMADVVIWREFGLCFQTA
jgi:hypothetical protein